MALNALYGGETDDRERARVMAAIRRFVSRGEARRILRATDAAVERLIETPPGDMRRERWDPKFRRATREYARRYQTSTDPLDRLAAAGALLYQVRCNLLHGSKDPTASRDRMLVRESVMVLRVLVPAIEDGAATMTGNHREQAV